jgi:conjugative relaxase-like TrwC/TraI family protein
MFTMAKIKDRNTINGLSHKSNYLNSHLIRNDYYNEKNSVIGKWCGKLAYKLNICGDDIKEGDIIFEKIRKNINPLTGEKLTPRTREGGIRFFDFQCSTQKSVSIMAVTLGDERLRNAHYKAFNLAIIELEKFSSRRDNSTYGVIRDPKITGNLCAAAFHHDASRSLDPQLHTHFVVANATYDKQTDTIIALESGNMIKAIRYAGKVYQNQLALNVRKLGYDIEEKINSKGIIEGFEIKGIPKEILKLYSKRRSVIEKECEKFIEIYGRKPTTEEINVITKESRNKKLTEITTEEVRDQQLSQLKKEEHKLLIKTRNDAIVKETNGFELKNHNHDQINNSIEYSIGHLYSRQSVLKGNQVLAECLNQGLGYIELNQLKEQIASNNELISLKENNDNPYLSNEISTVTGLNLELWATENINNTKNSQKSINKNFKPYSDQKTIELEKSGGHNFTENRKVIQGILQSKDKYMTLRGVAGAGKTTSLRELHKGLSENMNKIIYISPTTGGVTALKNENFKNSVTVEKFKLRNEKLDIKNGFIIIDEAGLLSNYDGTQLMKIAEKNNARILFVGDTRQHKSVAAGDFLRILETYSDIEKFELNKIYRQKNIHYKRAASMFASGDIEGGIMLMDTHESMKWINEGKGKYIDNSIKDYLRLTNEGKELDKCIFVTPTNNEAAKITDKLRIKLKGNNYLDKSKQQSKVIFKSENWTAAQKKSSKNYTEGQKILITITSNRFQKNELVTVSKIEKDRTNKNRVKLDDGRYLSISHYKNYEVGTSEILELCKGERIMARMPHNDISNGAVFTVTGADKYGNITTKEGMIIPKEYKSLQYGYVSTSHKKQGAKADFVVIAAESINRDAIYVASTRGVHECRINIPDKEQLYRQANILTERKAGLDLINKHTQKTKHVEQLLKQYGHKKEDVFNFKKAKENTKERIQTRNIERRSRKLIDRKSVWRKIKLKTINITGNLIKYISNYKLLEKKRSLNNDRHNTIQPERYYPADPFVNIINSKSEKNIDKGIDN